MRLSFIFLIMEGGGTLFYQNTWVRTIGIILFLVIFIFFLSYSVTNDSSHYLIRMLSERSFPFQIVLLEGVPGLSEPERAWVQDLRYKAAGVAMYLLTGVHITDARTYFLSYYAPPSEGLPWLGWAYYPNNPEMEGPILELLEDPFYNEPAPITSSDDILVGIYHTHNAESYAGGGKADRAAPGSNGDVVQIGSLLTEALQKKGINTVHSSEINDSVYIESYNHSYQVAKTMLEQNPTIRVLIDLHRDGLPPQVGKSITTINRVDTAKIMIVIGQKNPNWEKNTEMADTIIRIADQKFPGLFFNNIRYASEARYNQHLTGGAILLEVGSQLNTLAEAEAAVEPLAEVLKEYLAK